MFGASKKPSDLQHRFDEQFEKLTQYRKSLHQIAVHADVDISGISDLEQCATTICDGIDQLSRKESRKVEPGSEDRPISASVCNIKLDGCADVVVVQGDTPNLTIRCGDKHFLPKVLTSVSGNTLTIDTEPTLVTQVGGVTSIFKGAIGMVVDGDIVNRGRTTISMGRNHGQVAQKIINGGIGNVQISSGFGGPLAEVTVVLPIVSGLRVKGAGKVTYHGFAQEELNLEISGSGDIDLEGTADRLEADISGSGEVSAYGLVVKAARLRVSGSGAIRATATESARARVSGSGKIKIAGNPAQKDTDVSGSGKIKFVDSNA